MTKGFSLIELMISVAIISIISAIAVPAYRSYTIVSRAGECRNEVGAIRLGLEEFFLRSNTYTNAGGTLDGPGGIFTLRASLTPFYQPTNTASGVNSNCTYLVTIAADGSSYTVTANGVNDLTAEGVIVNETGP